MNHTSCCASTHLDRMLTASSFMNPSTDRPHHQVECHGRQKAHTPRSLRLQHLRRHFIQCLTPCFSCLRLGNQKLHSSRRHLVPRGCTRRKKDAMRYTSNTCEKLTVPETRAVQRRCLHLKAAHGTSPMTSSASSSQRRRDTGGWKLPAWQTLLIPEETAVFTSTHNFRCNRSMAGRRQISGWAPALVLAILLWSENTLSTDPSRLSN